MKLLAPSGFLLFTDYGPAMPSEVTTARAYQRYGAGVCIPLNFPLIGWHAENLGLNCTAPSDDDLPLHARLIARGALPRTRMRFKERFDGAAFLALERLIADAQALSRQDLPAARAKYRLAASLAPDNWRLLAEWAHMETEIAGDPQAALQIADSAIEINPACYADLWCEKGDALHRLGERAGAARAYQQALRVNAGHPRSHHGLAGLLAERGAFADALKAVGEALAGDPDGRHTKVLLERQATILEDRAAAIQRDIDRARSRQYG
jgi:tetratricopeptide (TPR) repeat protein